MSFLALLTLRLKKLKVIMARPSLLWALCRHRVMAAVEHQLALKCPLTTVIDIGANCGQFSLAVRCWVPGAKVVAFEPLAGPAARFRKVFQGDSKVILHQVAIGSASGNATIHVSAALDSSSLLPISQMQVRLFPGTDEVRTELIRVGMLSEFISCQEITGPAMLKLDVQGFELEVLRGCEDLLECFAYVYAECSFVELYTGQALSDDVIAWLRDRGFRLSGVYNLGYDRNGRAIQGDFLFARQ